jgi:hypothetical protein
MQVCFARPADWLFLDRLPVCMIYPVNPSSTDGAALPHILLTTLSLSQLHPPTFIYDPPVIPPATDYLDTSSPSTTTNGQRTAPILDPSASTQMTEPIPNNASELAQAMIETPSFSIVEGWVEEEADGTNEMDIDGQDVEEVRSVVVSFSVPFAIGSADTLLAPFAQSLLLLSIRSARGDFRRSLRWAPQEMGNV